MARPNAALICSVMLLSAPVVGGSVEPSSNHYRLVGSGPASVAASTASALYRAQLAGGSGAVVGIAASPNASVVTGPISLELPTARIFRDTFED